MFLGHEERGWGLLLKQLSGIASVLGFPLELLKDMQSFKKTGHRREK